MLAQASPCAPAPKNRPAFLVIMPEQGIPTPALAQAVTDLEAAVQKASSVLKTLQAALPPPSPDGPVFAALRRWRTEQARSRQLPPYVIASDAVLRAIEQTRPKDVQELGAIRGVGPGKAATYGNEILDVVAKAAA